MNDIATVIRWTNGIAFTLMGVEAARRGLRTRGPQRDHSALPVAVGLLGFSTMIGRIQEATGYRAPILPQLNAIAFVASGYFLLRFRHAMIPLSPRTHRIAIGACIAASACGLAISLHVKPGPHPVLTSPDVFAVFILFGVWSACVIEPAWRFWRAARKAPRVQRARARALATCFAGIAAILLIAIASRPGPDSKEAFIMQMFSLVLAPLMWIAAVPPQWLRRRWRASEETALQVGVAELLRSPDPQVICADALRRAVRAVGGNGGVISLANGVSDSSGVSEAMAAELLAFAWGIDEPSILDIGPQRAVIIPLPMQREHGTLVVLAGPLTPMFGTDELSALVRFGQSLTAGLDRAHLVEALSRETARSKVMLEAIGRMNEAILIIEKGRIVYANDALERLNGYPLEEIKALPSFLDIVIPEERAIIADRMKNRLQGVGVVNHYETVIRHKDGHHVDIEVSAQLLEGDGAPQILSVCRDITERKRVAAREARRAEELAAFSRAAQRLTGTLDVDALGNAVASCAREVIGAEHAAFVTYEAGEVFRVYGDGLSETDLARAGALHPADGYLGRLIAVGRPVRVAQLKRVPRVSAKTSAHATSLLAIPVVRGTQLVAVLFIAGKTGATAFDDIDENVATAIATFAVESLGAARAFERERALVGRLQELDEMKTAFMSALSHELRTPLTSVLGFAQTLETEGDRVIPEDRALMLQRLVVNARKLERLLGDLLDIDRLRRGIMHPALRQTDISKLVLSVLEEFDFGSGRTINLDIVPFEIAVDPPKVERIIENLLANAVKHTTAETPIWVRVEPASDGVTLTVEDAGEGVPDDVRDSIFEPFAQGPRVAKHSPGVGIGLSLVARFAELHGGRAWVENRSGGGASFKVFLPCAPMPDETAEPETASPESVAAIA